MCSFSLRKGLREAWQGSPLLVTQKETPFQPMKFSAMFKGDRVPLTWTVNFLLSQLKMYPIFLFYFRKMSSFFCSERDPYTCAWSFFFFFRLSHQRDREKTSDQVYIFCFVDCPILLFSFAQFYYFLLLF